MKSWGKSKSRGRRICSVVNDLVPLPEDPNSILSTHVRPFKTAWYPYSREFDTFLCLLQSPTNIYIHIQLKVNLRKENKAFPMTNGKTNSVGKSI